MLENDSLIEFKQGMIHLNSRVFELHEFHRNRMEDKLTQKTTIANVKLDQSKEKLQ